MKKRNTLLLGLRVVCCTGMATAAVLLASCVEVGVGAPYRYGYRGGYVPNVVVNAPGTHVAVGGPGYVQVLPPAAHPIMYRGEQCWVYGGRHYRRHGRGYTVFVP